MQQLEQEKEATDETQIMANNFQRISSTWDYFTK